MKAKYARQIRDGIVVGKIVNTLIDMGQYSIALNFGMDQMQGTTELTSDAYIRTLARRR